MVHSSAVPAKEQSNAASSRGKQVIDDSKYSGDAGALPRNFARPSLLPQRVPVGTSIILVHFLLIFFPRQSFYYFTFNKE